MRTTARSAYRSTVVAGLWTLSVLLALSGCGLLTDDLGPSGLEPGTFRLRADGQTFVGEAVFDTSAVFVLGEANLLLLGPDGRPVMQIRSADLLTTPEGRRFSPLSYFRDDYISTRGEVEITEAWEEVAGRYWFEMSDFGYGFIRKGDIRVEGAFRAPLPAGRGGLPGSASGRAG